MHKRKIQQQLTDAFHQWDSLLAELTAEISEETLPSSSWSVKNLVAHLMAWQQVTNARLTAAFTGEMPVLPEWLEGQQPEKETMLPVYNQRIKDRYQTRSWEEIYRVWRDGFLRLLDRVSAIPEEDFLSTDKFSWLYGYPLMAVLEGTLGHHREHFQDISKLNNKFQ